MAGGMKTGSKGAPGAQTWKLGSKPPKQKKVGGISTPFSSRVMSGKR